MSDSTWVRDVRPMSLVDWGTQYRQEVRPMCLIKESTNEIRPSVILKDGDTVGKD